MLYAYIYVQVIFKKSQIVQLQFGFIGKTQEAYEYKPVKPQRGSGTRGVETRPILRLLLLYGRTVPSCVLV